MKIELKEMPREFGVGQFAIRDWGRIELDAWEMVTIRSITGRNCDITATNWGFYLGSSLNARLRQEGFKVALVRNSLDKFFINVVELDKMSLFEEYLKQEKSRVVTWLDEQL
ncbi:MAG: hypothetical protein KKD69_00010 [Euryarchaeota archaeon]|nr:hypothetical protein [Euryarchaeota archaeon]